MSLNEMRTQRQTMVTCSRDREPQRFVEGKADFVFKGKQCYSIYLTSIVKLYIFYLRTILYYNLIFLFNEADVSTAVLESSSERTRFICWNKG